MIKQFHPYHLISPSPWPLLTGFLTINILIGIIVLISKKNFYLLIISIIFLRLRATLWWRDVSRESSFQGYHDIKVINGLRLGILLFITSEILFFLSFFWIFFHRRLAPNIELGRSWPPLGILAINPFQIPLLNTIILLSSGISVTWAHHALLKRRTRTISFALYITIFLGIYFSALQGWEYIDASFSFADSVFGSSFFIATGFHGIHVIVGTIFLFISLERIKINIFSKTHHLGFEIAIWYWHFVDVVWLFLYSFLYWWAYFIINIKSIFDFQSKSLLINNKILILFFRISIILIFLLLTLSCLLKPRNQKSREKRSPFECGFDPSHKIRDSFSLRFFLITLLFLIFDVEAAIILPIPLRTRRILSPLILFSNTIIFLILSLGLLLEWKQGILEWTWAYI